MSIREDRLLAGKQVFAKVIAAEIAEVTKDTRNVIEPNLLAKEAIAAELPDGTCIGSVSRTKAPQRAAVTDVRALLAWVREHKPSELVESVNPAYIELLKTQAKKHGHAFDHDTGEVIPGVEMVEGTPSYLVGVDEAMVPLIKAKFAELISAGLLDTPAIEQREAS